MEATKFKMTDQISPALLQIYESQQPGFNPLVDTAHWSAALLNFDPDLTPQQLSEFQRHDESQELFVLLSGRCILFIGEGEDSIGQIYAQDLEPFKLYCVQRRTWHTQVLSVNTKLLIVENQNTSRANSPRTILAPEQHADVLHKINLLWGGGFGGHE
jgi:hypothetical protein